MSTNPSYNSVYVTASPSKRDALKTALDTHKPLKEAKVAVLGEHNPPSPWKSSVDGYVMLTQNLTHNTLSSMFPSGVLIMKKPTVTPPADSAWTANMIYDFVKRGNQSNGEYRAYGTSGENYDPTVPLVYDHGKRPHQGKRSDVDDMIDDATTGMPYSELRDK